VAEAFGLQGDDSWSAKIAGHYHTVYISPPDSRFADVNILGGDFCIMNRLRPWIHENSRAVTYYIGKGWEVFLRFGS
jgi:hypothetical protein